VIAPGRTVLEMDIGRTVTVAVARLEEDITRGQSVARYTLYGAAEGEWRVLSHGSTIGYAKLDRFEPVSVRRVRLTIEDAAAIPQGLNVRMYNQA
jgi:alpha-L-fucosidase